MAWFNYWLYHFIYHKKNPWNPEKIPSFWGYPIHVNPMVPGCPWLPPRCFLRHFLSLPPKHAARRMRGRRCVAPPHGSAATALGRRKRHSAPEKSMATVGPLDQTMGFSEIFCCFVPRNLYDDPNSCEKKKPEIHEFFKVYRIYRFSYACLTCCSKKHGSIQTPC